MNRRDLARELSMEYNISIREAEGMVDFALKKIENCLLSGETFRISGLFSMRKAETKGGKRKIRFAMGTDLAKKIESMEYVAEKQEEQENSTPWTDFAQEVPTED